MRCKHASHGCLKDRLACTSCRDAARARLSAARVAVWGDRRDARRRSGDATNAALSEALGRFGASGEWDGATPTAFADDLGRSGPPAWAENASDRCTVLHLHTCKRAATNAFPWRTTALRESQDAALGRGCC